MKAEDQLKIVKHMMGRLPSTPLKQLSEISLQQVDNLLNELFDFVHAHPTEQYKIHIAYKKEWGIK